MKHWVSEAVTVMFEQKAFAVKSKNDDVRSSCTSGGIFWEFASNVIDRGGVVYGCAFDQMLVARHVRCTSMKEVARCMGSKYSQSDMGDSINGVIRDLKAGLEVLFTGTPCQVAGVRKAVSRNLQEHLLLVDLVCHGAPSPLLFQQHLGNIERTRNKRVVGYKHRPKNKGWGEYLEIVNYSDGSKEQGTRLSGVWKEIFYSDAALRPSCYSCPFSINNRPGDITIGDYWGIENILPDFRDSKGVSLAIVNTSAGEAAFDRLDIERIQTSVKDAFLGNPNLVRPTKCPARREAVWEAFSKEGFSKGIRLQKFYAPLWKHAYRKTKPLLRKIGLIG